MLDRILSRLLHSGVYDFGSPTKILIYSGFTLMLDILQDYLFYRNVSCERLDGSLRAEDRYSAIDSFTNRDTRIFLLSSRAGGLGINLTAANIVIFYDHDWNPTVDEQAEARYVSFLDPIFL